MPYTFRRNLARLERLLLMHSEDMIESITKKLSSNEEDLQVEELKSLWGIRHVDASRARARDPTFGTKSSEATEHGSKILRRRLLALKNPSPNARFRITSRVSHI